MQIKRSACIRNDTIIIGFIPLPLHDLGADTTLCVGEILLLSIYQFSGSYFWKDGSIQDNFTITKADTVWVEVTVNECKRYDAIEVNYISPPSVDLGKDTVLCEGQVLNLQVYADSATYLWNNWSMFPQRNIFASDASNNLSWRRYHFMFS